MALREIVFICLLFTTCLSHPSPKIDPKLAKSLQSGNLANVFVKFQGGNSAAIQRAQLNKSENREDRINQFVSDLKSISNSSQQNAWKILRAKSPFFSHKQFWINNELYVKGANEQLVLELASLPEVEMIREELLIYLEPTTAERQSSLKQNEWNIEKIQAQIAWNIPGGNNGNGVVVANIDTGVRRTHDSLKNNQRNNYNWFDPYEGTTEATDSEGRGTRTMGIIAGSGGIGVAPGAQWISCKGCHGIECAEDTLIACGQWILCPTLFNGDSPDCSKAPQVVSNAWVNGLEQSASFFRSTINAWVNAGIIPVFGVGDNGPACGSVEPPADHAPVAVGATDIDDKLWDKSAAGPTNAGVLKPDISAPGVLVRSASNIGDNSYQSYTGTGMAAAHVAGATALLLSRNPNLTYLQVRTLLINNVDTATLGDTGQVCSGIASTEFPNLQYGYGRLNAHKALAALISS